MCLSSDKKVVSLAFQGMKECRDYYIKDGVKVINLKAPFPSPEETDYTGVTMLAWKTSTLKPVEIKGEQPIFPLQYTPGQRQSREVVSEDIVLPDGTTYVDEPTP